MLKRTFYTTVLAGVILSIITLTPVTVSATATPTPDESFISIANHYIDDFYFPSNPSTATVMGIHTYDNQMEDYSKIGIEKEIASLKQYQLQMTNIDMSKLSEQQQGDYQLILNNIKSELLTLEKIKPYEKDPDIYSSGITNSAFVIMERNFAPLDDRLSALIAREKLMPAALDQARKNLKNPPKIYTEIALQQLPGIIQFFQKDLTTAFAGATDPDLNKEFIKTNNAVIAALKQYQTWLKKEVLPRSHGDFKLGADTYQKKVMYDEMVDLPLDKLIAINTENMRQNKEELKRIGKEIDPTKTPKQILQLIGKEHPAPDQLLNSFKTTFDGLIKFIKDKHIITIPSDIRPTLEETPPFMRATTFASMDTPGPFEPNASEAYFNVTLPEPSWTKKQTADFMTQFNSPVISSISVHEAYPGHYVQFLWIPKIDDRIRKIFGAASNSEGWAHYCEQMMVEQGLGQSYTDAKSKLAGNLIRLGVIQESLLRNARFMVGIKMHTGQMTFNQAVKFFMDEGFQSHAVAVVETKRGTSNPTYLYYTLGKLEILKLRADLQAKEGATFSLQKFHDDFMRQGFPPIKIVRKALLHDDSAVL